MPKYKVRMVFETTEFPPVEIYGYVESNEPNMFSKEPEHQISIICPETNFKSIDPTNISGETNQSPIEIDYKGTVETGIVVVVTNPNNYPTSNIWFRPQVNDPLINSINVPAWVGINETAEVSSIPGDKYINHIGSTGIVTSLVSSSLLIDDNDRFDRWPMIGPGTVDFSVLSEPSGGYSTRSWALEYYEMFGSL